MIDFDLVTIVISTGFTLKSFKLKVKLKPKQNIFLWHLKFARWQYTETDVEISRFIFILISVLTILK